MTITQNPPKNQPPTIGDIKQDNQTAYREWRDAVAQLLQDKGHFSEAERWDYCDDSPRYIVERIATTLPPSAEAVWVCSASSEHDAVLFSSSCDFRICPDCAHKHTARLVSRYVPVIDQLMKKYPDYRLRTLTFTRSIELGDSDFKKQAQSGFDLIQKAMSEVVGEKWNKDGAGLLANWEAGAQGKKLHYHAVYLGNWVDQKRLSDAWRRLTDGDFVVWVSAVKHNDGDWQGAVMETLKYATKFYSEDRATGERIYLSPSLTVELFEALKGARRIRSWGSFYNIEAPPEQAFCCVQCNAKMVRVRVEYFEIWRETGFTRVEWKRIIGKSLLQYRTANKSPPKDAQTDKAKPKQEHLLPGFDKIRVVGTAHYDYD